MQSQNKILRKKEKSLIKQAYRKETKFARTDYQDEAGRNGAGLGLIVGSPELDHHFSTLKIDWRYYIIFVAPKTSNSATANSPPSSTSAAATNSAKTN